MDYVGVSHSVPKRLASYKDVEDGKLQEADEDEDQVHEGEVDEKAIEAGVGLTVGAHQGKDGENIAQKSRYSSNAKKKPI